MALYDAFDHFGYDIDPTALSNQVYKKVGNTIDLQQNTYARFGGDGQTGNLGLGDKMNVHFIVSKDFSQSGTKKLSVRVATSATVSSAGALNGTITGVAGVEYTLATKWVKGYIRSIVLPVGSYERYLGIQIISDVDVADEAGRFSAWLAPDDWNPELSYVRARGWVN